MTIFHRPDSVENYYEVFKEDEDVIAKEWKHKSYKVTEFERDKKFYSFLEKDDKLLMFTMFKVVNTSLGKTYSNTYVQKSRFSFGKNVIPEFVLENARHWKCDAIYTDSIQSSGGVVENTFKNGIRRRP